MISDKKQAVNYKIIMSQQAKDSWEHYLSRLLADPEITGRRFRTALLEWRPLELPGAGSVKLLETLFNTKPPKCFAEMEVRGDGSDWNQTELKILGDLAVHCPVTVFDNGWHNGPQFHEATFRAQLVFVAGALLKSSYGKGVDEDEVVGDKGLDFEAYCELYKRRLYPSLFEINQQCKVAGKKAIVTMPSLGCGQFAGRFKSTLTKTFERMLIQILETVQTELTQIKYVYYNPWTTSESFSVQLENTKILVRGSGGIQNNAPGQLARPAEIVGLEETEELELYSFVAWDHVSWPGNDFYDMARMTDDGVKAAATTLMTEMTGLEGRYDSRTFKYMPLNTNESWKAIVIANQLKLKLNLNNLRIHQHLR